MLSRGGRIRIYFEFCVKALPLNAAQLSLVNSQLEVREEGFELPLEVIVGNKLYGRTREGKGEIYPWAEQEIRLGGDRWKDLECQAEKLIVRQTMVLVGRNWT